MKSTTRFSKNIRGIECLNCKQPISNNDNFCSNCGQVNDELPLSIKQFISEFFSGFFSFDTRFFNTFIPLLFKPGKVSREYIEGKRRRYVNPFQLYLHVTILYFLINGLLLAIDEYKISDFSSIDDITAIEKDSILNNIEKELTKNNFKLDFLAENNPSKKQDSLNAIVVDSTQSISKKKRLYLSNTKIIKARVDSIFKNTHLITQLNDSIYTQKEKDSIYEEYFNDNIGAMAQMVGTQKTKNWKQVQSLSKLKEFFTDYTDEKLALNNVNYKPSKETKLSIEDQLLSQLVGKSIFKKISVFMEYDEKHEDASVTDALKKLNYEKTSWNVFYYKKAQDFNKFKKDADFRNSYVDSIISKISIALFFMLPIFTLFLSLLYIRHRYNYTEHLVFVFNIQTVFFILLIISTLINQFLKLDLNWFFILIFLFYLYKSLRNFYKQKRVKTVIKYFLLNTFFMFLSTIGFIIISFIAFAL